MQRYIKRHVYIKLGLDYAFEIRRIKGLFVREKWDFEKLQTKKRKITINATSSFTVARAGYDPATS